MGQSYRGTEAAFIDDAMFKLPYELMGTVIDKKDQEIQGDIDARNALSDLLNAQGLKADEPRLQQILKQYQNEIDESVQNIYKDPLNYSREGVQRLKRKITEDFTLGEVAAIQGNKAVYDAWVKSEEEKIKKDPSLYAPGQFEAIKAQKLADFTGTNFKSPGEYSFFETEGAIGVKDTLTVLDELMKGAIPDFESVSWDSDQGGWNVKGKRETKLFKPKDLENMYQDFLSTNPDYLQGIMQRQKYGIPGFQNSVTPEGLNLSEGSFFGDSLDLLKTKYGGVHSVTEDGKTRNAVGNQEALDKMETVYVDTDLSGDQANIYTSYSGKDLATYNANFNKNLGIKADAVNSALQLLADKQGYSSIDELRKDANMKANIAAIEKGNFSSVADVAAGKSLEKEYKSANLRLEAQKASRASFLEEYPGVNLKDTKTKIKYKDPVTGRITEMSGPEAFSKYLTANYSTTVDTKMSWKPTNITKKQMDNVAKQVIDNGLHMSTPITMPAGMIITNPRTKVKTNVGGKRFSINDLIGFGLLPVEQKEIERKGAGITQVITYSDGVNTLNFDTGSTGVTPIWASNDSSEMEYGLKVNINGEQVVGKISNIGTEVVDNIMSGEEGKKIKAVRFVNKLGGAKKYTFPGGPTYYNEDVIVNGKRIRKKGDLVYNGQVSNISDEETLLFIGELLD
jgi:hypothetical protein